MNIVLKIRNTFFPWEHGTATVRIGYGSTMRYKARRHRATGRIQLWCREWLPTDPNHETSFEP